MNVRECQFHWKGSHIMNIENICVMSKKFANPSGAFAKI